MLLGYLLRCLPSIGIDELRKLRIRLHKILSDLRRILTLHH